MFIPPAIDKAILKAAERQLSRNPSRRPRLFWVFSGLATAGAVVLIGLASLHFHQADRHAATPGLPKDLNQDGQIDILDAFALARQLKQGHPTDLQLDVNGDGVIDDKDIAALAAQAVKLEKGGRS